MCKENASERGDERGGEMEIKLYNKYAYDYLYTRDGEEEREGGKARARSEEKEVWEGTR